MARNDSNKTKGAIGEAIAADYLEKLGFTIVEKNWHYSRFAEIDIIAKKENLYIFVEVKTRTNCNYGHPFEAIDYKKLQHIQLGALAYLDKFAEQNSNFRIDVIGVINPKNPQIEHLQGISL